MGIAATPAPYSRKQWVYAVCLSGLVGWCAVGGIVLANNFGPPANNGLNFGPLLAFYLVFGLLPAFAFAWLCISPVLYFIMRHPVGPIQAAKYGFGISAGLVLIVVGYLRFQGWLTSQYTRSFAPSSTPYPQKIGGLLTPNGEFILGQNTIIFLTICTMGALLIQWVIGPGKPELVKGYNE